MGDSVREQGIAVPEKKRKKELLYHDQSEVSNAVRDIQGFGSVKRVI